MNDKKRAQLQRVRELAREGGVEILAHIFQRSEVRLAADFVGGSLEVVERARASRARAVMVCGASFMLDELASQPLAAELLIPRRDISCPLAEAVSDEEVLAARERHPAALVAADLKARPALRAQADLVISPATAKTRLAAAGGVELIALPGPQVADWAGFGPQVVHRWPRAVCQVHELALAEDLAKAQAEHPTALTAANLLCRPEVQALADFVGDSAALRDYCLASPAAEFILVCEAGLAEYLAETRPDRAFYETEAEIICPNMKLTTLKSMIDRLEADNDLS